MKWLKAASPVPAAVSFTHQISLLKQIFVLISILITKTNLTRVFFPESLSDKSGLDL